MQIHVIENVTNLFLSDWDINTSMRSLLIKKKNYTNASLVKEAEAQCKIAR